MFDINFHIFNYHLVRWYKLQIHTIDGPSDLRLEARRSTQGVMTHIDFLILNSHVTVICLQFIKKTYLCMVKKKILTPRARTVFQCFEKMHAISLHWFIVQQQTSTFRRQNFGFFYVKFSAEFNELNLFF